MNDLIGSSHMIQGNLTSFIEDRFGCLNSSLALNGGWTQVPSGIYFDSPEFTISSWVYPQSVDLNARVIDFGNGISDNIAFNLLVDKYPTTGLYILSGNTILISAISTQNLKLDEWQFLVATFDGKTSSIYINGTLVVELAMSFSLLNLTRTNCFIGKSNWEGDGFSQSYLDDLRFYNKNLTQTEIVSLMNQNQKSKN